jgi:hypothetical protein
MRKNDLSKAAKLIARKGGSATLKKYGKKHYKAMAKIRWAKSRLKLRNEILEEEINRDFVNDNRPKEN